MAVSTVPRSFVIYGASVAASAAGLSSHGKCPLPAIVTTVADGNSFATSTAAAGVGDASSSPAITSTGAANTASFAVIASRSGVYPAKNPSRAAGANSVSPAAACAAATASHRPYANGADASMNGRSEEHTSELQSRVD